MITMQLLIECINDKIHSHSLFEVIGELFYMNVLYYIYYIYLPLIQTEFINSSLMKKSPLG